MHTTPYISFNGNCEEALNFYAKALGGEIGQLMRFEGTPAAQHTDDPQKVLHAALVKDGNALLMASDGGNAAGSMVSISVHCTNRGEIEKVFGAMSEGGKVTMPLEDTFWGAVFGMLQDRFGVSWMFNYDKAPS